VWDNLLAPAVQPNTFTHVEDRKRFISESDFSSFADNFLTVLNQLRQSSLPDSRIRYLPVMRIPAVNQLLDEQSQVI
jgi:hypothetical protein